MPTHANGRRTLAAILFIFLAASQGWAQEKSPSEASEVVKERLDNMRSKMWWNQSKKIEELTLTEQQRSKMDSALEGYIASRRELVEGRSAFKDFGEALAARNRAEAEKLSKELVDAMAKPLQQQLYMMIEVIEILSPEQTALLLEKYPQFLSRAWIQNDRFQASSRDPNMKKGGGNG